MAPCASRLAMTWLPEAPSSLASWRLLQGPWKASRSRHLICWQALGRTGQGGSTAKTQRSLLAGSFLGGSMWERPSASSFAQAWRSLGEALRRRERAMVLGSPWPAMGRCRETLSSLRKGMRRAMVWPQGAHWREARSSSMAKSASESRGLSSRGQQMSLRTKGWPLGFRGTSSVSLRTMAGRRGPAPTGTAQRRPGRQKPSGNSGGRA